MELKPEDVLSMQHKGWLDHPVTKQMMQVLEKQREHYVKQSKSGAWYDELDYKTVRNVVAQTVMDTTITAVTNTEQFIKQLTQ
jgi:hypothetical protein